MCSSEIERCPAIGHHPDGTISRPTSAFPGSGHDPNAWRHAARVVGLEAVDDIETEDYENVIVPAVEAAIAQHGKVRLVYVLGHAFDEYQGEAVWEDIKLGVRHPASFERMAIVTDARWAGSRDQGLL